MNKPQLIKEHTIAVYQLRVLQAKNDESDHMKAMIKTVERDISRLGQDHTTTAKISVVSSRVTTSEEPDKTTTSRAHARKERSV